MPINRFILTAALLANLVSSGNAASKRSKQVAEPQVVAYVFAQDSVLTPEQIDGSKLTRINYAFANIKDGRMVTGFAQDEQNFATLNGLKAKNTSLKVLVSVGGWLWSTNFSDVSLTRQSREVFIRSVMEFLGRYDLDGLDIDWEYPGMVGSGHPFRPEDKENFTSLVKELREQFDQSTVKTHKRLYLTIAAGASDEFLAHSDMGKVQRYLDTVNLMAYDYYEPGSDALAGNHAPLFTDEADPKKVSGDASVKAFEAAGVPAAKILLGVPFYGHVWGGVGAQNHGLFQPGKPVPNAYAQFDAITQNMLSHGYDRYWDAQSSVPYLYNPEKKIFVSYEDPMSLAAKCKYVLERGLGGVMFWDYSGDPSGTLLNAIHDGFVKESESSGGVR